MPPHPAVSYTHLDVYKRQFTRIGNEQAKWEVGYKANVGIDMEILGSLNLTIDYFTERRTGIFQQHATLPSSMEMCIRDRHREALEWLERTGNGKVHGTTRLVPREEFAVEKSFLIPYHGTPQPPQEEMREYHVRKDNTCLLYTSRFGKAALPVPAAEPRVGNAGRCLSEGGRFREDPGVLSLHAV